MPASIVWQNKKRNEHVTGTWQKAAFQCSLLERSEDNDTSKADNDDDGGPDSGGIPLSSATGYHCITHCTSCSNAQGSARPMFPDVLVRIPARALGVKGKRERIIPGISSALQSSLSNVSCLQAYVAVYSPDEQLSTVRFCFQFCSCIQDAEPGRCGERGQKESYDVPTEVGLFDFSRQSKDEEQQQQQEVEGGGCLRNGLQEVRARVFVGGTVASSRCGDTGSQIKRVQMKSVCSVDLNDRRWRAAPFAAVFSLCVTPASSQKLQLGEDSAGCLVLHVFPRTIEASDAVTKAVRAEQRLGPLLHQLRETTAALDDDGLDGHRRTVFHALTRMLDAACAEVPTLDQDEKISQSQQQQQGAGARAGTGMSSAAASMSLAADAATQFLPDTAAAAAAAAAAEASSVVTGTSTSVNQPVYGERGSRPSSSSDALHATSSSEQPVTTTNTEDQHQRLLRRREKWLAERFMALHTRERLHQVQARERALRSAEVNSANPVSSIDATQSVQEALELQRAEGAAAMQAFQTALLSRVDEGFLKVEASLRDYVKDVMTEHMTVEQHHRAETVKQLEDRICRKLEERAADFAQGQFRMLQESVRQNQLALQQLYAQTAQRTLVAPRQRDLEDSSSSSSSSGSGSRVGTTARAKSAQEMLPINIEHEFSATAEAVSSPNASFLLEGPSTTTVHGEQQEGSNPVAILHASQAGISQQSNEDEMLLLRAKEQELRHLESRLRLKENHLLALEEELDERARHRSGSDFESAGAHGTSDDTTTGMEHGDLAQNSTEEEGEEEEESQRTPSLQLVHSQSNPGTGTPAITSPSSLTSRRLGLGLGRSAPDILLPFQQRSEAPANHGDDDDDDAGRRSGIVAHGGEDADDDDVTPVKGLPLSSGVDSSESDTKPPVKTFADQQDQQQPICEFCHQHGHLVGSNLEADHEVGASSKGPRILFCPELTSRQWTQEDVLGAVPQFASNESNSTTNPLSKHEAPRPTTRGLAIQDIHG